MNKESNEYIIHLHIVVNCKTRGIYQHKGKAKKSKEMSTPELLGEL